MFVSKRKYKEVLELKNLFCHQTIEQRDAFHSALKNLKDENYRLEQTIIFLRGELETIARICNKIESI